MSFYLFAASRGRVNQKSRGNFCCMHLLFGMLQIASSCHAQFIIFFVLFFLGHKHVGHDRTGAHVLLETRKIVFKLLLLLVKCANASVCVCVRGWGLGFSKGGGRKGKGVFKSTFLCVQRRVFPRIFRKILWETAAELEANPKSHYVRSLCTFVAYFWVLIWFAEIYMRLGKTKEKWGKSRGWINLRLLCLAFLFDSNITHSPCGPRSSQLTSHFCSFLSFYVFLFFLIKRMNATSFGPS